MTPRVRGAACAVFLAIALIPSGAPPAFAQTSNCEPNTLRIASTRDFKASPQGRSLVFETLTALDDAGAPVPRLATSWEISDDELRYDFDLRRDVTFHDGAPFTADAVVFSIERAAETAGFGRHFEGVEVAGPHRIRLRLAHPYWPLLTELSFEHIARIVEPGPVTDTPAGAGSGAYRGTGPFVLVRYEAGAGAELVPNEDYWGARPLVDRLIWSTLPDPMDQIVALEAGRVDLIGAAEHHGSLPYEAFGAFIDDPRFETRFRSYGRHQVLDFNVTRPPLGEIEVRRAIDAAIDRERLVHELMGGLPSAETTLNPPRPDWRLGPSPADRSPYDPQRSAALLASAGWAPSEPGGGRQRNGTPLEVGLLVNEHERNAVAAARFVEAALGEVGFRVTVESVPGAVVSERLKAGDFDVHVSHTCSVAQLGCLGARGKYTRFNETRGLYSTPEIEGLIDDALGPAETAHQEAAFDQLWQALSDQAVAAPLFDVVKPMTHGTNVRGVGFGSTVLTLDLSRASVEAVPGAECVSPAAGSTRPDASAGATP